MTVNYLTVQALTKYIKRKFEVDPYLREVYVKGELSNVKLHTSGHIYFTLKDEKSQIQAVMYARNANALKFKPENGMKVMIQGDVNVYESSGRYQLYANDIQPDGVGSLHIAFEQLKKELEARGYFKPEFKQPIVKFPKKIGVITAKTGAAIRDILSTLKRHYPIAEVVVIPTLVQGKNAAPQIAEAIKRANEVGQIDTLIVGRGGGSIEDLWAFNEEIVAQAIFESHIPIISAVGHETDVTITDFVADLRAPTPTGAAKMAVPDQIELMQYIMSLKARVFNQTQGILKHERARLNRVQNSYTMQYPDRLYRPFIEQLARLDEQLDHYTKRTIERSKNQQMQLTERLRAQNPIKEVQFLKQSIDQMTTKLSYLAQHQVEQKRQLLFNNVRSLEILNPLAIMTRGYAILYEEKNVVKSIEQIKVDQNLKLKLADGQANVKVLEITKSEGK
ncbi:exodeoxyribonuclease 7 large subunit [Kurthia zopfii]|uniref:Exodeoxyribonuclease 7 large subunit n=1 Tax=Kurthia zopfii TaxID=1650 RepID=A0A2U3ABS3_9BACL|nr:exodeoxyribonuclease VII large subunit [Kurthia zopfii]PWI21970.1 exodeoxyribonuclease VII large subunit [Kurthia zopfii]TDR36639.1 exodeoxyribonuclease VII large subunit [Kurthia zopfii]STX09973.1 Exodeoxyribonuclease 7 large subunit [Kurthia zopfii]VEI07509.1 Exodeoxyribonuclease 7 large subunit [Kurthia zopfii]GEK30994.1 exodeoxyribonuclease 7 large subunit [Kurthia zopfii]